MSLIGRGLNIQEMTAQSIMSTTAMRESSDSSFLFSEIDKSSSFIQEYAKLFGNMSCEEFLEKIHTKQQHRLFRIFIVLGIMSVIIISIISTQLSPRLAFMYFSVVFLIFGSLFSLGLSVYTTLKKNPIQPFIPITRITIDALYGVPGLIGFILSFSQNLNIIIPLTFSCIFYSIKLVFSSRLPIVHSSILLLISIFVFVGASNSSESDLTIIILASTVISFLAVISDASLNIRLKTLELQKVSCGVYKSENYHHGIYFYYNMIIKAFPTYEGSILVADDDVEIITAKVIRFSKYANEGITNKLYFVKDGEVLQTLNVKFVIWLITDPKHAALVSRFSFKKLFILSSCQLEKQLQKDKPDTVDIQYSDSLDVIRPYMNHASTLSSDSEYILEQIKSQLIDISTD